MQSTLLCISFLHFEVSLAKDSLDLGHCKTYTLVAKPCLWLSANQNLMYMSICNVLQTSQVLEVVSFWPKWQVNAHVYATSSYANKLHPEWSYVATKILHMLLVFSNRQSNLPLTLNISPCWLPWCVCMSNHVHIIPCLKLIGCADILCWGIAFGRQACFR